MEEEQQTVNTTPPEEKIKELIAQGTQCLNSGQNRDALVHFQSALALTETIDKPKLKLSCLLNTGAALVTNGEHQRGISLLQSALSLLDSIPNHDKKTKGDDNNQETHSHDSTNQKDSFPCPAWSPDHVRGDIYYNMGLANEGMGERVLAITQLKQSVDYYIKAKQQSVAGDVLCVLASCFKTYKDHKQQINSLLAARQLYNESNDSSKEATCNTELALAYHSVGNREECLQNLTTAKIMGLRLNDAKTQAHLYSQLGLIYSSLKMFPDAIQSFERALSLKQASSAEPVAQLQYEAGLLQNIGAVYNEMGQYVEAMMYHKTAANLYSQTGQSIAEAKCLCNLALCQTILKDYTNAFRSYTTANTLAQESHHSLLQFQSLEGLATLSYHTKDYHSAERYFKEALSQLDLIKDGYNVGVARERVMEKLSDITELLQNRSATEETDTPSRKTSRIKLTSSNHSNKSRRSSLNQVTPIPHTPRGTVRFSENSFSQSHFGTPHRHGNRSIREGEQTDRGPLHSSTLTSLTTTSDSSLTNTVFNDDPTTSHTHGMLPMSPIIPQGSLALGPNTKSLYTVQKQEIETNRRGRIRSHQITRIVPLDVLNQEDSSSRKNPAPRTSTRSSVCILL